MEGDASFQERNVRELSSSSAYIYIDSDIAFVALRILKISTPSHESSVGDRIDASHNLWDGSGLKIDSANTDVAWGCGSMSLKFFFYASSLIAIQSSTTRY